RSQPLTVTPPFLLPSTVIAPPVAATVCSLIKQCEARSPFQLSLHDNLRSSLPRSSRSPRCATAELQAKHRIASDKIPVTVDLSILFLDIFSLLMEWIDVESGSPCSRSIRLDGR